VEATLAVHADPKWQHMCQVKTTRTLNPNIVWTCAFSAGSAGSAVPSEPMSGREVTSPDQGAASSSSKGSDGGGGSNFQPWKTALAVILPVLLMALLAYQVC
jgi:hypothetical protein